MGEVRNGPPVLPVKTDAHPRLRSGTESSRANSTSVYAADAFEGVLLRGFESDCFQFDFFVVRSEFPKYYVGRFAESGYNVEFHQEDGG